MGSADYFFKVDDTKTAIILEAKQELDKKHPKNLKSGGGEVLFTREALDIDIIKAKSMKITHKRLHRYLRKKIIDFDKYDTFSDTYIDILNSYLKNIKSKKINTKEETIKRYLIEKITDTLDYDIASMEHGVDNDTYTTPEEQIKSYLNAKEYSEYKAYGILSNGLIWKLYYKDKSESSKNEPIAVFDLSLLLEDRITKKEKNKLCAYFVETFKFTNLLANEKNFKCSLMDNLLEIDDCHYSESLNLSERLFKNIINKGYIELAKGIASASKANKINLTPLQLEQYSMKVLFRFIFILYAEARGFLPLNQTTYYDRYSLEKIARELGRNKDTGSAIEDDLWARMNDLFRTIDNGKMGGHIKVPVYNGGLFREYKDDLLNRIYIENSYLTDVLFSLIYHEKKVTYDRIDYNLLDIKYIGTVYERLLDYKIVTEGAGYRLAPKEENNTRKGLGAYYTPDHVTKYMIKNSVDKKIDLFKKEFDNKFNTTTQANIHELQDHCILKRIFELKVIDISCGSGHFLIDTIEYLTDSCTDVIELYNEKYSNFKSDTLVHIENILREINSNEEYEQTSLQKATHRDVVKRFILKSCIYGIDINPLATDITKFAIWLETFVVGVPLSFMDNHIKQGNSVLGFIDNIYNEIDLSVLSSGKENLFLADMKITLLSKKNEALGLIEEISELLIEINSNNDISTQEVEENYANYAKIDSRLNYLRFNLIPLTILHYTLSDNSIIKTLNSKQNKLVLEEVLKVYTEALQYTDYTNFMETYFIYHKKPEVLYEEIKKHQIKKEFFDDLLGFLKQKKEQTGNKISNIINNTFDYEYTNWFLEFPQTKFDIVIGNPPYVKANTDGDFANQRDIILKNFDYETLYEKWDLMMAFVERGYKLLKDDGILSLIIKDDYLKSKYASKSREYFAKNVKINRIDFLSDIHIFSGVGVKNIILEYEKNSPASNIPLRVKHTGEFGNTETLPDMPQPSGEELFSDTIKKTFNLEDTILLEEICYISVGMVANAHEKIAKNAFKLKDLLSKTADAIHCKTFVEGKNLRKWRMEGRSYIEWNTDRVPSLLRRPTFPELYEQAEKLMLPMVGDIRAAYDNEHLFCNHGVFVGVPWIELRGVMNNSIKKVARYEDETPKRDDLPQREELEDNSRHFRLKYILAILNSSVAFDMLNQNRRNDIQLYPDDWKKVPIKIISDTKQLAFVEIVDRILEAKSSPLIGNVEALEQKLDGMVSNLYEN